MFYNIFFGGDSGDGGNGGWGGSGHGSGHTPTQPLTMSPGTLRPCTSKILQDLRALSSNAVTSGSIATLLNDISSNSSISVTFMEQAQLKGPTGLTDRAQTIPGSRPNTYTIVMNSDFLSGPGSATDLAIAGDIIHELVHVYMFDWAANHNISTNNSLDFIMNLYFQNNQHATMTDMVSQMGTALLDYYNSTFQSQIRSRLISQSYCELLIWGNLTGTSTYISKAQANPAWDMQVKAIKTVEQHPDEAAKQMGNSTLPFPAGGQPCQ